MIALRVYDFFGYYSLSYLACSRQILRGQRAEFKGLAVMDWDFSAEHASANLPQLAPVGSHLALRLTVPPQLHRLLVCPTSWVALCTAQAYRLRDPVVAWALWGVGSVRWSAITLPDPLDILGQAGAHGLVYGATVSTGPLDARTIGSLARSDRELTDQELARAEVIITQLHQRLMPPRPLTRAQVEALRLIAKGYRYADAAKALQISQSALKARITAARHHLRARTTAEAIQRAASYDLI